MAWVLFIGILLVIGFIIYRRKKGPARLSAQEIQNLVTKQMKELDDKIVSLSIEGKTFSLPSFLAHLEESKREHAGDQPYIEAMDQLIENILRKYGEHIPPDEAFIEDGEMIIWNEYPGCYERHLQRRYRNLLFSPERRIISKKDIQEARAKDKQEKDDFIESFRKFAADLNRQLLPKEAVSAVMQAQELLEKAASIGGDLQKEIDALEKVENDLDNRLNEVMPQGADLGKKMSNASSVNRIPFMAQRKKKNSPILNNEEIPTLLSEDLSTVAFIGYASRCFPGFRPSEADIKQHLAEAIRQGFAQDRADDLLKAWNEMHKAL